MVLRHHDHSRMRSAFQELRELRRHRALVVGDEDPAVSRSRREHLRILESSQAGVRRRVKLDRRLETKNTSDDNVIQIFVGLKSDFQGRFARCRRASASF